ncbi:BREX system ATP-binding protein BrxD [Vulgatibacter incomptus]|uniref:Putative ATP /GTP binding protein n=1 Tax=Vulgatibacter incomptus TaxID=1391653 RepID=A0A0K1PBM3_9BACT|nr:BREX system ATP-binding protein BrxD [Vulgatibacter incomptus]AKU90925.1 putative ATP /GTP binding protein [Vulgatibacter incomptus]
MAISQQDREHIFERLRGGLVPERGLEAFAVGIDRQRAEIERILGLVGQGEGLFKFFRGGYGCGKTFMARLALLEAQAQGFATSFVVVSDNDLHFHKFDELYRKVVGELSTRTCPRGALGDIVDRWIGRVEESLIAAGADEGSPAFDEQVKKRMGEEVESLTRGAAPEDFVRVLRTVFELKQEGNIADAGALLSWLAGSANVAASAKKRAGIKGDIESTDAMRYLRGILEIVKAAGYRGLVIVIDEAETILRMRSDSRGKSLNGIRQICDDAPEYKGLLWIFTGTPDFFDTRRGVAGLPPLHDRIQFQQHGGFVNPKQPQLELRPFTAERLRDVALKLRELYAARDAGSFEAKVSPVFIDKLVAEVTKGLGGDVGKVPRQFLRQLVDLLDLTNDNPEFDPLVHGGFEPKGLNETEQRVAEGLPPFPASDYAESFAAKTVEW